MASTGFHEVDINSVRAIRYAINSESKNIERARNRIESEDNSFLRSPVLNTGIKV